MLLWMLGNDSYVNMSGRMEVFDHSSRGVLPTVARRCVWSRNLETEEAKARYRAVKIQPQWVVMPGKQTTTNKNGVIRVLVICHADMQISDKDSPQVSKGLPYVTYKDY